MARRGRDSSEQFNEGVFEALRGYLSGDATIRDAAKKAKIAPAALQSAMHEAYKRGFLVLTGRHAEKESFELRRFWMTEHERNIEALVGQGCSDDEAFARFAAEMLLRPLRDLLEEDKPVAIGIISGSSTGSTVQQLVEGRLWDELMSNLTVRTSKVDVLALNVTPVVGDELEGNANVAVLHLATFLQERLPEKVEVNLYGLISDLVVNDQGLLKSDKTNIEVVRQADPERLPPNLRKGTKSPGLDLVITGVGTPKASIFANVLTAEGITAPPEMAGDVGFWPVDSDGGELTLTRKGAKGHKEKCYIYSAIRPQTLKQLVDAHSQVVLIARDQRRGKRVDKTAAITAAVKGGYINVVVTDIDTAHALYPKAAHPSAGGF